MVVVVRQILQVRLLVFIGLAEAAGVVPQLAVLALQMLLQHWLLQMAGFHQQQITVVGLVTCLLEMFLMVVLGQFLLLAPLQPSGVVVLVGDHGKPLVVAHLIHIWVVVLYMAEVAEVLAAENINLSVAVHLFKL
jgi:hypothetical protein